MHVIGLWVSSSDTLAPEYTALLGEPPKGACIRLAVWALSHAVHRAHPRVSLLGHGEGGHARWPAKNRTNERWPRSLGVDWCHKHGGVERATLPRCPPAVHSELLGANSGCYFSSDSSDFRPPVPFACAEWVCIFDLIDKLIYYLSPLDQPKWISGSEQHFGWIRGGAGGESDRRVGLNRMRKMTPGINPKLNSNPIPKIDRVVWAK